MRFTGIALAGMLVVTAGCGSDSPKDPTSPPVVQPPAPTTGTLTGRVTSAASGAALAGAAVSTQPVTSNATTDAQGNFTISTVPAGTYTVTAMLSGHSAASATATVTAGQAASVSLALTPLPPPPGPTSQFAGRWAGTTSQNRAITLWVGSSAIDSIRVEISVSIISGFTSCTVTFTPANVSVRTDGSFSATLTSPSQVSGTLTGTFQPSSATGSFTAGWNGVILCGGSVTIGTGGSTSNGTWQAVRTPLVVSSVTPSSGPVSGGTSITISGWFDSTPDSVRIGGARLNNLRRISSAQIAGTTPPGAAAGAVTVTAYAGTLSASCSNCFTYNLPPSISAVSPSTGSVHGGSSVTINGSNFPGAIDSLRFGLARATNVTRVSSTQITASTPAGAAAGPVDVVLFASAAGDVRCAGCFTYVQPTSWSRLASGSDYTCGLAAAGAAYCWGSNSFGQLGDGSLLTRSVPTAMTGNITFTTLAAGASHACGLSNSGIVYCWGWNFLGQLGNGSSTDRSAPTPVSGSLTYRAIAGGGSHTCGVTVAGAAQCWGANARGQLGDGSTTNRTTPVAVAGGLTFTSVTTGGSHSCGLTSSGNAHCWGSNVYGQLGDGSTSDRNAPVAVAGGVTFTRLTAGENYTCGLTSAGIAYCWGYNAFGELGDGSTAHRSNPTPVSGGHVFSELSAGANHACGIAAAGVYCWGTNVSGQLGDGTTANRTAPVAVSGGVPLSALSAGGSHTCGIRTGGAAYCWGWNNYGQLGDGTRTSRRSPVPVINP